MSRRHYLVIVFAAVCAVTLICPGSAKIYAEENVIYGHISYVDNEAFVLKSGEDRALKAVVNLPLVPGDIIYTEAKGRCEIQFDNGTLLRLDKNTELKLETVLSKGLTTKDKITTLQLKKGAVISMNQVYNGEIFQLITPTAAIKMYRRSTNCIKVNKDGETHGFVERGKIGVLYSRDHKSGKKEYVGAGKGFLVTKDGDFKEAAKEKDIEFHAWNAYLNKHFKELHYGKSKIPALIYRRSPGIVHFAEKWSTKFGVWEYNDLFGYVWKPAADIFHGNRPFWDANYVRINGELVLVPNQPWGWAPAHLGTWFFSKTYGWIWIPGDAFSRGICAVGLKPLGLGLIDYWFNSSPRAYAFSTLGHWIYDIFGDSQLYYVYRTRGSKAWRNAYSQKYDCEPASRRPSLKGVPENIKDIIKKLNKAPVETIKKHLTFKAPGTAIKPGSMKVIQNASFDIKKSLFRKPDSVNIKEAESVNVNELISHNGIDWNPDSKWASKVGVKILYSSKENAVMCPELDVSSRYINDLQRNVLRRSVVDRTLLGHGKVGFRSSGLTYGSSSFGSSSSSSHTGSAAGKATGTSSGSSGSGGVEK